MLHQMWNWLVYFILFVFIKLCHQPINYKVWTYWFVFEPIKSFTECTLRIPFSDSYFDWINHLHTIFFFNFNSIYIYWWVHIFKQLCIPGSAIQKTCPNKLLLLGVSTTYFIYWSDISKLYQFLAHEVNIHIWCNMKNWFLETHCKTIVDFWSFPNSYTYYFVIVLLSMYYQTNLSLLTIMLKIVELWLSDVCMTTSFAYAPNCVFASSFCTLHLIFVAQHR